MGAVLASHSDGPQHSICVRYLPVCVPLGLAITQDWHDTNLLWLLQILTNHWLEATKFVLSQSWKSNPESRLVGQAPSENFSRESAPASRSFQPCCQSPVFWVYRGSPVFCSVLHMPSLYICVFSSCLTETLSEARKMAQQLRELILTEGWVLFLAPIWWLTAIHSSSSRASDVLC